jgi:hypothetical protein
MKITKLQLRQIIREEIIDWQGKYNDDFKFKVGMLVKDINPDCPHQGSEGIVTKATPDEVTYTVSNNGKNYKIGNILTKTKDQLTPLKLEESIDESGILYKAGVKKYGKEGMRKIQQAAGKRKSHAEIGAIKDKYEKNEELNEMAWSSPEAKTQVDNDVKTMSKVLGKASQGVIKIMISGVKSGKYDAMDLSKGIETGDISRMHFGEADFLLSLWTKMREKFRKYSKQQKLK